MKSRILFGLALLVLFAAPASAQKVYIDYDSDYDFKTIKTFAWRSTPETSLEKSDPLLHSRIMNGIEHHLSMAGLTEVDDDPDVFVTYHTDTEERLSLNTTSFGYGYPGGWYGGGYYGRYGYGHGYGYGYGGISTASTTVSSYELGTLVVDVWDRKTEKLVWRGMAANITVSDNPTKMAKKVDKALAKIVAKSQKLRKQDAKKKAKQAAKG